MPFTTALKALPSLPNPEAQIAKSTPDTQVGKPTREFYTFLTQLRALLDTLQDAVGEGGTTVKTVATLPTAVGVTGVRYMVSDANATTFNSTVAGGGANIVPVFSNGTNWKIG